MRGANRVVTETRAGQGMAGCWWGRAAVPGGWLRYACRLQEAHRPPLLLPLAQALPLLPPLALLPPPWAPHAWQRRRPQRRGWRHLRAALRCRCRLQLRQMLRRTRGHWGLLPWLRRRRRCRCWHGRRRRSHATPECGPPPAPGLRWARSSRAERARWRSSHPTRRGKQWPGRQPGRQPSAPRWVPSGLAPACGWDDRAEAGNEAGWRA